MTITLDSQGTNMVDRNDVIPKDYCGIELSDHTIQLLTRLSQVSFSFKATGKKKTLQIWGPELQHGYIDSTVYQKKDLIGYRFPLANGNACHENLKDEDKLAAHFQKHYGCPPEAWRIHYGSASNTGKQYIRFLDPDWAYKVLLQDAKIEPAAFVTVESRQRHGLVADDPLRPVARCGIDPA